MGNNNNYTQCNNTLINEIIALSITMKQKKEGITINTILMSRKEVAEYLGVCQKTADNYIKSKDFDGIIRIGRRVLVSKEKLDKYIRDRYESAY